MVQKLLQVKKQKVVPEKELDRSPDETKKIVLVGTYAGDLLKDT